MMAEERERMAWLCQRIQEEKDQQTFTQLVAELNELLARAEKNDPLRRPASSPNTTM